MSYKYQPTMNIAINIPRFSYRKLKSNAIKKLNTTSCNKKIQENTVAIETDHLYKSVLTAIQIQEFIVHSLKLLSLYLLVHWNFQRTLMIMCLFIHLLLEIHKRKKQVTFRPVLWFPFCCRFYGFSLFLIVTFILCNSLTLHHVYIVY